MKTVVIQGLGFVGAAMAIAIANVKNDMNKNIFDVIGIDVPTNYGQDRIDKINQGIFPFKINDMELISKLQQCVKTGNLKATTEKKYFKHADVIIICINCDLYKLFQPPLDVVLLKLPSSINNKERKYPK